MIEAHIEGICLCPEGRLADIDPSLKPRLKSLLEMAQDARITAMKSIIDDSVAYSLTSDFGLKILLALQDRITQDE